MTALLLAMLLSGPAERACQPLPHLVGTDPYTFVYDPVGCHGKVYLAVFRVLPDFEPVDAVVLEHGAFAFEGEPGTYQISVCYSNGFADLRVELP